MNQLLVIEGALVLALMLGGFQGTGCTGQKLRIAGTVLAEYGDSAGNRTIVLDSVHLMAAVAVAVYDFIEQGYLAVGRILAHNDKLVPVMAVYAGVIWQEPLDVLGKLAQDGIAVYVSFQIVDAGEIIQAQEQNSTTLAFGQAFLHHAFAFLLHKQTGDIVHLTPVA